MKQWGINVILTIGITIAIGFSLLKITPFEITSETYIGTIVTLLSLAAAFVIGYQIYNAIELKKDIAIQKKKYNNIIKRNEEIEIKLSQQEFVMQEGFDIISSLIQYNNGRSFIVCGNAFQAMHKALVSSIETDRVDYDWIFGYLRKYIADLNSQTFAIGLQCISDDHWMVTSHGEYYGKLLSDVVDEFIAPIKENDKKIRLSKNFCEIQFEYERIMKLLNKRLSEIVTNPQKIISDEDKEKIIHPY